MAVGVAHRLQFNSQADSGAERLASGYEPWELGGRSDSLKLAKRRTLLRESLEKSVAEHPWAWPKRSIIFVSDPHADTEAFEESLVVSGGVKLHRRRGFVLTAAGRKASFVIGGDCLDKGPSNLALLRSVKALMDCGADVKLLAGNHDVRFLIGLCAMSLPAHCDTEHMFARMSPKVVPLLHEIYQHYLQGSKRALRGVPSREACQKRLLPAADWFERFEMSARGRMPDETLQRELARMQKKISGFESAFADFGMDWREVYATAKLCQKLFLKRGGEFFWFFNKMQLAYRSGSFLFIHAGLDDQAIEIIKRNGVKSLNKLYKQQLRHNLFDFYYGSVANTMRTKYRDVDMPLSNGAVAELCRQGIHAVVHGHRNRLDGQRLMLRQGLLHIEGDITMDRNSRLKEGLTGIGVGATIIESTGRVLGVSNDYPAIKEFSPARYLQ